MTSAGITLGRDALRMVAGAVRRTIPRHQIVALDRVGERAILAFRGVDADESSLEAVILADFADVAEAQQIEDWLLDGMPGVSVSAEAVKEVVSPTIKPGQEIGPGSVVEYLGKIHEVSREAHDHENGIRKWRLNGHTSRGVNESALRLVTPIRKGDKVTIDPFGDGVVVGPGSPGMHGEIKFPIRMDDGREAIYYDREILHASRSTDDGVAVVR